MQPLAAGIRPALAHTASDNTVRDQKEENQVRRADKAETSTRPDRLRDGAPTRWRPRIEKSSNAQSTSDMLKAVNPPAVEATKGATGRISCVPSLEMPCTPSQSPKDLL